MSGGDIVHLAKFRDKLTAEVARIALEAEEIPCIVVHGNQGAYPGTVFAPVILQVFREDLERAQECLRENELY